MALSKKEISQRIAKAWVEKGSAAGLRDGIEESDSSITGLTDAIASGIAEAAIESVSSIVEATEAEAGIVELATAEEVTAGTDAERAVTPAALEAGAIAPLRSRVTAAARALLSVQSQVAMAEGDIDALEARAAAQATSIAEAEADIGALQARAASAEARLDTAETDIATNTSKNASQASSISTLQSDLTSATSRITTVERDHQIQNFSPTPPVGAALSALGFYRVRLASWGTSKPSVIAAVRGFTGLSLAEGLALVNRTPVDVLVVSDAATAQSALASLQAAGATATVIGGSASIDADLTVSGDVTVTGTLSAPSLLGDPETGNFHFNNSHLTGVMGLTMGVGGSIDGLQSLDVDYLTTGQELTANNYLTVNGDLEVNGPAVVNGALSTNSLATDSIAPKTAGSAVGLAGDLNVSGALSAGSFSGLPAATTVAAGILELATADEVAAGTDQTRAVTPYSLAGCTATSARAGLIELATATEALAGTDTARGITPYLLKYVLNNRSPLKGYYFCRNTNYINSTSYVKRLNLVYSATGTLGISVPCIYDSNGIGNFIVGIGGMNTSSNYYRTLFGICTNPQYGFYSDDFVGADGGGAVFSNQFAWIALLLF